MRKAFIKVMRIELAMNLIFVLSVLPTQAQSFLEIAKETGVTIKQVGTVKIWEGPVTGKKKLKGPLAGKTIGVLVASEFSDFQAHYIASYGSEFGGKVEFLFIDWVTWKFTRPNVLTKGVQGMWGMSIGKKDARYTAKSLSEADPGDYDALLILGGHSGDIMMPEDKVIDFIQVVYNRGTIVGAIGEGSIPLITAGIMNGKKATGNNVVSFMLKKIAKFQDAPVVRDDRVITARNTVDTPDFLEELCKAFEPNFVPKRKGILTGKKVLVIAGEDFEDVELVVPVMEYLYRGASVTVATFPPPMRSRPPMLGLDVVQGNFGVSVPLQEISLSDYRIVKLSEVRMEDFDVVQIPGAFCPWNMVMADEPVEFLKKAHEEGKIIAAICHGPIAVAAADLVKGKKIAGWLACKDAVRIMGGTYSYDWSAVIDGQIVTGRVPPDVPEFLDAITEALVAADEFGVVTLGAKVEKLAEGFAFTEGPAVDAEGNVFFTDIPNNRIHKWSLDGKLSTFRENSGGANGLFIDKDGNLLVCEGGNRRLVSIDPQGKVTVLVDRYNNKKLNSPNDLWIDPKGGIYFTDPRYGDRNDMEQDGEHVYYLSPGREKIIRVIDDMTRPNGILGTSDGKRLYVADHGGEKTYVYTINVDGTLSDKKLFAPEGSDGMTIDREGNVYLTGHAISVYNSAGKKIKTIEVPEQPANVCFGGKDSETLFITARTSLYSIRMRVQGL